MTQLLVAALLLLTAGALAALFARGPADPGRLSRMLPLVGGTLAGVLVIAALANRVPPSPPAPPDLPLEGAMDDYVTSERCRSCHPRHYDTWYASYHRTMTQVATPESVMADSTAFRCASAGAATGWFRDGDALFGEMPAPGGGGPIAVPLKQTTGSHHTQVYWYPAGTAAP